MPSTVVFTGHMLDRPGRSAPRFAVTAADPIAQRIAQELEHLDGVEGYASAACGGDIVFHEAMLRRGGKIHIVLPCNAADFRKDCVEIGAAGDWGARFDRLLGEASSVEILGEEYASDNAMAAECCNRVIVGLAARTSMQRRDSLTLLALWDGRPGDAVGGTQSMVQFCMANGVRVRLMGDLAPTPVAESRELLAAQAGATSVIRHASLAEEAPQQICAVVFADVVGFSKLRERDLPKFSRHYLAGVMKVLAAREIVPLVKNTWGDGLYLVFDSMRDAGLFAVDFRDLIVGTDWRSLGLPADFNVRIGVHAGPLYRIYDPVLSQWGYTGTHITRAARIEPTTPPGQVYASLAFSALAAAERVTEFSCQSVGRIAMAKGYGEMMAFRLERT